MKNGIIVNCEGPEIKKKRRKKEIIVFNCDWKMEKVLRKFRTCTNFDGGGGVGHKSVKEKGILLFLSRNQRRRKGENRV